MLAFTVVVLEHNIHSPINPPDRTRLGYPLPVIRDNEVEHRHCGVGG